MSFVLVLTTSVVSYLFPGVIAPVEGTAFDLRKPVELGKHLQDFHIPGFDHNFCLKGSKEKHFCARFVLFASAEKKQRVLMRSIP